MRVTIGAIVILYVSLLLKLKGWVVRGVVRKWIVVWIDVAKELKDV